MVIEPESPALHNRAKRRDSSESPPKIVLKDRKYGSTEASDAPQQLRAEDAGGHSFSSKLSKESLVSKTRKNGSSSNKSNMSLAMRRSQQLGGASSLNNSGRSFGASFESVRNGNNSANYAQDANHLSYDGLEDRKRAFSISVLCNPKKDSTKVDPRKSLAEGKYNIPLSTSFSQIGKSDGSGNRPN